MLNYGCMFFYFSSYFLLFMTVANRADCPYAAASSGGAVLAEAREVVIPIFATQNPTFVSCL